MDLASTTLKIVGAIKGGNAAKKAADDEATLMRKQAAARRAEGHHQSEEEKRQARHIYSRALAVSAASGGGTGGTVTNLLGDIDAEGDYRALMRRYSADAEAESMEDAAVIRQKEGRAARSASRIHAATTLFDNSTELWDKYKKYI